MKFKKATILKFLRMFLWLAFSFTMIVVLASAIQHDREMKCKEVKIEFVDNASFVMLEEKEVMETLWPTGMKTKPDGMPVRQIDLLSLEETLEKNPWVLDADIFVDHLKVLHIEVSQRKPVARIFTPSGSSFFLDADYRLLPVKYSDVLSLPVFTNCDFKNGALGRSDTLLMDRIIGFAGFINRDPFLMALAEQVYVGPSLDFEMITQVGDQTVFLGDRSDWELMIPKLKKTYQYFAAQKAWSTYETIDLHFRDQVVCKRKSGAGLALDSTQLKMDSTLNIQEKVNQLSQ